MCIIIDANMFSDYCDQGKDNMEPVRNWMREKGNKIAYSPTGKIEKELNRHRGMRAMIDTYDGYGKVKVIDKKKVEDKIKELKRKRIKSDDPHIIALAQASGTTLLVTKDDNLASDFKNRDLIKNGKIYKGKRNKRLLEKHRCL